jgi:hypothetical protein
MDSDRLCDDELVLKKRTAFVVNMLILSLPPTETCSHVALKLAQGDCI